MCWMFDCSDTELKILLILLSKFSGMLWRFHEPLFFIHQKLFPVSDWPLWFLSFHFFDSGLCVSYLLFELLVESYRSLEKNTQGQPNNVVSLAKWRILNRLHDRNETLYYRVSLVSDSSLSVFNRFNNAKSDSVGYLSRPWLTTSKILLQLYTLQLLGWFVRIIQVCLDVHVECISVQRIRGRWCLWSTIGLLNR